MKPSTMALAAPALSSAMDISHLRERATDGTLALTAASRKEGSGYSNLLITNLVTVEVGTPAQKSRCALTPGAARLGL